MRICLAAFAVFPLTLNMAVAATETKAPAPPKAPTANYCAALTFQFDSAEKDMAREYVDDLTDNSAPRAQLRATNINNAMVQAQIALELMRARSCTLPSHAPWTQTYFSAALACKVDRDKGLKDAPSCNRDRWEAQMPRTS